MCHNQVSYVRMFIHVLHLSKHIIMVNTYYVCMYIIIQVNILIRIIVYSDMHMM